MTNSTGKSSQVIRKMQNKTQLQFTTNRKAKIKETVNTK